VFAQAGFDFAQFDTETAHLDLLVDRPMYSTTPWSR